MAMTRDERRAWFEAHILPFQPDLLRFCRSLTRSDEAAHDLTQDTLTRVLDKAKLEDIQNPKSFLFRTANNLFINTKVRQKKSPVEERGDLSSLIVVANSPPPDEALHSQDRLDALREAINELPPKMRRVFVARKVYGLSQAEIAKLMGVSQKTVEKHASAGLKRCRAFLVARGLYWRQEDEADLTELKPSAKRAGDDQ